MTNQNNYSSEKPLFITFEGIEGSGKTTQVKLLQQSLINQGKEVVLTREPGGTEVAEKLRTLLLEYDLDPLSELLLIMAARKEHLTKIIQPALKQGKWVICDRFIDSTACYQGTALGIDLIYRLHNEYGYLMPDLTIFLDINPSLTIPRIANRPGNNRFDNKNDSFHWEIYNQFLCLSETFSDRIKKIPVQNLQPEEIHELICNMFRMR